ncbi:MAG: dihydropteroate synthase [Candidatus Zophobacter franzmannii]|nr:dihydropteroate synthase [Candidatus Zophobacter franzmannii]
MNYLIRFKTVADVENYFNLMALSSASPKPLKSYLGLNYIKKSKCTEIINLSSGENKYQEILPDYLHPIAEKLLGLNSEHKLELMGILNVTPDSFSDGSYYLHLTDGLNHAKEMLDLGADIIDIGGESTRPGAENVDLETELKRVIQVIEALRKSASKQISIDTYKAEVASKAINAGADIVNDISALRFDPEMINVLKEHPNVKVVLMHMNGIPKTMQKEPHYTNVIEDILEFFEERINYCIEHGISKDRIIIDPGIGFGKRHEDNLNILRYLSAFHSLGCKVLLGTSRKSFINRIVESKPSDRLAGTLATTSIAIDNKIDYIRIHDIKEHIQFIKTYNAIIRG